MSTTQILIVFSALMALIALVTIGIDWIGKPLKNRRFIPRIYRFDDEKLPVDAYGHTDFSAQLPQRAASAPAVRRPARAARPVRAGSEARTIRPRTQPAPRTVAHVPAAIAAPSGPSRAFSDNLGETRSPDTRIAGVAPNDRPASATATGGAWQPGMALDMNVDDRKPSLATKAERFWMTTAQTLTATGATPNSHFDDEDLGRMAAGKAPRRTNPRTGRAETMQLTGLRRASSPTDVRMLWPDDAVDPWAAS